MWRNQLRRLLKNAKSVHYQTKTDTSPNEINFLPENYFKKLYPWKSKDEFIASLIKSVFFNHDGLLALNKPYGVAIYKHKRNDAKMQDRLSRSCFPETNYCLEDALSALKEQFNLNHLEIMKSTERYTTGVCLFATTENSAGYVRKAVSRTTTDSPPYQTYWAITRGSLSPPMACTTVGLKMVNVEDKGVEPEIIWEPSQNQRKRKLVKPIRVEHRVLCSNRDYDVAVCEVSTKSNKSHFVRLYCIQRSSCVLGDTLYSPRLRTVLGRTVVLGPRNYDKDIDPLPTLKNQVTKSLGINCEDGEEMAHLPVLLHLRSLRLTKWYRGQDLVLTAPLPEHFKWTCGQLNLDMFPVAISERLQ